jgi:hypothetical protein
MKVAIILSSIALVACFNLAEAQNKNVQSETTTKITTIKDNVGEKKIVKKTTSKEVQNVELGEETKGSLNIPMKDSPVQVTATTELSVDGETKAVDIDRSAYYMLNGKKYQIAVDSKGYIMQYPDAKKPTVLRQLSNKNYIFKNNDKISVGYFDKDGNLILETYDDKTDAIVLEKFELVKP